MRRPSRVRGMRRRVRRRTSCRSPPTFSTIVPLKRLFDGDCGELDVGWASSC